MRYWSSNIDSWVLFSIAPSKYVSSASDLPKSQHNFTASLYIYYRCFWKYFFSLFFRLTARVILWICLYLLFFDLDSWILTWFLHQIWETFWWWALVCICPCPTPSKLLDYLFTWHKENFFLFNLHRLNNLFWYILIPSNSSHSCDICLFVYSTFSAF